MFMMLAIAGDDAHDAGWPCPGAAACVAGPVWLRMLRMLAWTAQAPMMLMMLGMVTGTEDISEL